MAFADTGFRIEAKLDLLLNILVEHIGTEKIDKFNLTDFERKILSFVIDRKYAEKGYVLLVDAINKGKITS